MQLRLCLGLAGLCGLLAGAGPVQAQAVIFGGGRPPVTLATPPGYIPGAYGSWGGTSYRPGYAFYTPGAPYSSYAPGAVTTPGAPSYLTPGTAPARPGFYAPPSGTQGQPYADYYYDPTPEHAPRMRKVYTRYPLYTQYVVAPRDGITPVSVPLLASGKPAPVFYPESSRAVLQIKLPTPEAELWVQNEPIESWGVSRQFQSPPLSAGSTYRYQVKARWLADGQFHTQTKTVKVQAGADVVVSFP
jgi:uncharacterized protein (TIGR03000 family)